MSFESNAEFSELRLDCLLRLSCYILNIPFILHMHSGYTGHGHEDDGACRLDLDDLGGEVVLIDWGQVHILKSRHVSLL